MTSPTVRSLPVLAFHAVQRGPGPLCLDRETFAAVVCALVDAGASGVTAADASRMLDGEVAAPAKPVVFTFDDGYRSVFDNAFPVLDAVGWPATVFPVTNVLGGCNTWDGANLDELTILDRDQLATLHAAGWEIGGHTHTHRSLVGLTAAEVQDETDRSNEIVTTITGERPLSFAYPFGRCDAVSRRVAARCYRWCWTIGSQRASHGDAVDALPRIEAWYVRHPRVAGHLHDHLGGAWLAARRAGRAVGGWTRR